jgi:hypothetical protein
MSAATRVLAVSALVVGLCPALAFACEDEASAKAEASAKTVKVEATCKVTSGCTVVKIKTSCSDKTVTAVADDTKCTLKVMNTQGAHHAWEPGHLIEPDSMKLGPGDELNAPNAEQWVRISSRGGSVQLHRGPWGKKTEGRTWMNVYGPYRVFLQSQLP